MAGEQSAEQAWATQRDLAVRQMDALLQVTTEVHEDLQAFGAALAVLRNHLRDGGRATEVPATLDIKGIRASFTESMEQLERARAVTRISLWRLQLAEGWTKADVARVWGYSRQLVSRSLGTASNAGRPVQGS